MVALKEVCDLSSQNAGGYLKGGCQEDGARVFPVVPSDRTRGNGHKLKQRKLQLNHRITESQNSRGWKGPLWVI